MRSKKEPKYTAEQERLFDKSAVFIFENMTEGQRAQVAESPTPSMQLLAYLSGRYHKEILARTVALCRQPISP